MLVEQTNKRISKFLSLVLRHKPEVVDIKLDNNGYVDVKELIKKINSNGSLKFTLTMEMLEEVVATSDKKRYAFNENKTKIRANQGHSVNVDLLLQEKEPPKYLYHGTALKNLDVIKNTGLVKMSRHHVHLSEETETATNVGSRHGKPYVLTILAQDMVNDGHKFYLSDNGVWLSDFVPPKYISFEYKK